MGQFGTPIWKPDRSQAEWYFNFLDDEHGLLNECDWLWALDQGDAISQINQRFKYKSKAIRRSDVGVHLELVQLQP